MGVQTWDSHEHGWRCCFAWSGARVTFDSHRYSGTAAALLIRPSLGWSSPRRCVGGGGGGGEGGLRGRGVWEGRGFCICFLHFSLTVVFDNPSVVLC